MGDSNGRVNLGYTDSESDSLSSSIKAMIACRYDGKQLQDPESNSKIFSSLFPKKIIDAQTTPGDCSKGFQEGDKKLSLCNNCSLLSVSWVGEDEQNGTSSGDQNHSVSDKCSDGCFRSDIRSSELVIDHNGGMGPFKYLPEDRENPEAFQASSVIANYDHHDHCKTDLSSIHPEISPPIYVGHKRRWICDKKQLVMRSKILASALLKYLIVYPLICLSIWALFYILWGNMALPGGSLFALVILEVSAIVLGRIAELLHLPPLVGMLSAGFIIRNVSYINIGKDLQLSISSPLRAISVVILLTRGAFSVNPTNIKKFKNTVPSLAIGSCIIEAICGGLAAYFVIGFPPAWSALMGCIMSAMSGAAVMPYLLSIEKTVSQEGAKVTGKAKESLVIAKTASGLDAILAICMAECCFGFIFGEGILSTSLLKGVAEVAMGGAFGLFWGGSAGLLLNRKSQGDLRVIATFCGGVMSLLGLTKIGYPRGGPLGVFLGSLIAITLWRHKKPFGITNVTLAFDKLWFLFQPLLFGIMGARTNFDIVNWMVVRQGAICLGISMTGRLLASFLTTSWSQLPFRERFFLVTAWLPKGTVQAALGPVALDTALDLGLGEDYTVLAYQVMNVAATTIVLASVIGSLILKFIGPRFLNRS